MPKMKIFNSLEKEAFDSPPVFNSAERKQFFSLPLLIKDSIADLRTPTNKVCFLVVAGYFKARRKFFARQFHQADIEFVARQTDGWVNRELNMVEPPFIRDVYHVAEKNYVVCI